VPCGRIDSTQTDSADAETLRLRSKNIVQIPHSSLASQRIVGLSRTRNHVYLTLLSSMEADDHAMPGAFPSGPEDQPTVQRAPKKRFIGRRALEAQTKQGQDANTTLEETSAITRSSEYILLYRLSRV
jgi:hypothetical protein